MIKSEAKVIFNFVSEIINNSTNNNIKILNIGTKTTSDSNNLISKNLFLDIKNIYPAVQIITADLYPGKGVDFVIDICNEEGIKTIQGIAPDIVIVSNLLEHVTFISAAIEVLYAGISNCAVIISGPRIYPLHLDPIDNNFRPTRKVLNQEISDLFRIEKLKYRYALSGYHTGAKSFRDESKDFLFSVKLLLKNIPLVSLNKLRYFFPVIAFVALLRKL